MRVYNFSAGPSMLPMEVLEEAQRDFLDYNGTGMSVVEMSHRSKPFQAIVDEAEALLRELMNIPVLPKQRLPTRMLQTVLPRLLQSPRPSPLFPKPQLP